LTPAISVIVATIERWPAIQPCLDRLAPQVAAAGGELIALDGTQDGSGVPANPPTNGACTIRLMAPCSSVLALRARGADAARADILAFTEDHCVVSPDWVERLLRAHGDHPAADMVSGPVTNGSAQGLMDWANFLATFAEFLPPPRGPLRRTPPSSNASFRRRVMIGNPKPEGWLEVVLAPTLVHERRVHYDAAITVSHVQPRRVPQAMAAHFHNGRACAGLALPHMARRDWWVRFASVPLVPWILFGQTLRSIWRRPLPARAYVSLPFVFGLCGAHAAGELVGLVRGEGRSAKKLN
jgi:hypothetical protein